MTISFATEIWAQERNIMRVSGFSVQTAYVQLVCNTAPLSGMVAKYVRPETGALEIDLSDVVRLIKNGNVSVSERTAAGAIIGSATTKSWERAGLINPESVQIPDNPLRAYGALIVPPDKLIDTIGYDMQDTLIVCEFFGTAGTWNCAGATMATTKRYIGQISGDFTLTDGTHTHAYKIQAREACKQYADVRWVSFSGIERVHTFEVINCTTETIDAVQLENLRNFYDIRKGRQDSFKLRLEELSRYDFWYYADMITSSKVEISLDGTNWRQVQVVTKSVQIPDNDEGKPNTLEIEINYRKYDTL